eukprot:1636016-Amphidinium_carterae.1
MLEDDPRRGWLRAKVLAHISDPKEQRASLEGSHMSAKKSENAQQKLEHAHKTCKVDTKSKY